MSSGFVGILFVRNRSLKIFLEILLIRQLNWAIWSWTQS